MPFLLLLAFLSLLALQMAAARESFGGGRSPVYGNQDDRAPLPEFRRTFRSPELPFQDDAGRELWRIID